MYWGNRLEGLRCIGGPDWRGSMYWDQIRGVPIYWGTRLEGFQCIGTRLEGFQCIGGPD